MSNSQFVKDSLRTESPNYYPQDPRIIHAAIGLVTESGELIDALKKAMFYGKKLDLTNIKEEAGDILWYLAILFDALGTDFDTEQARVIAKLKARFPEKFTEEKAENRDLVTERAILENEEESLCVFCEEACRYEEPIKTEHEGIIITCNLHKSPF